MDDLILTEDLLFNTQKGLEKLISYSQTTNKYRKQAID